MSFDTIPVQEFYTVREVAGILRITVDTLRQIVKRRRIPVHQERPGAQILVKHSDLEAFVNGMRIEVDSEKEHVKRPRRAKDCG